MSVQTRLIAMRFWPTVLTTSASESSVLVLLTGMSLTVPVIVPPGSPFARSAAEGPLIALISAVVIGFGGAAGEEAAAGEGAWASTNEVGNSHTLVKRTSTSIVSRWRARLIRISIVSFLSGFPDGILQMSAIKDRECADRGDNEAR